MALVYVRFRDPVIHPRTGGAEPVLRSLGGDGKPDCVFEWQGDELVITAAVGGRWLLKTPRSNVVVEAFESDEIVAEREAKALAEAPLPPILVPADVDTSDALAPLGKAFKK